MLRDKQLRFLEEFLIDGNGTAAAIRAGYSKRSAKMQASRLMTNDDVLRALDERRRRLAGDFRIKHEDVLAGFLVAIQRASDQDNPAAMISGWREVAKLLGFNEPERISVQLSDDQQGLQKKFEALSDAELLAVMQGGVHHEPAIQ
jgi:phage terminase small subunit